MKDPTKKMRNGGGLDWIVLGCQVLSNESNECGLPA